MEIKHFFRQIRQEYKEIQHLEEAIRYEHLKLLPGAIQYDKPQVQTSPADVMSETLTKIAENIEKLDRLKLRLETRRNKAYDLIAALDKSEEREIMRLYYMEPKKNGKLRTWEDVADETNYSTQHIFEIHGKALRNLNPYINKIS